MNIRKFFSIFTAVASAGVVANIAWLAVLAAPISWLWNGVVVQLWRMPTIAEFEIDNRPCGLFMETRWSERHSLTS